MLSLCIYMYIYIYIYIYVPSCPPRAHSSKCGARRESTTSRDRPLCTGNASDRLWHPTSGFSSLIVRVYVDEQWFSLRRKFFMLDLLKLDVLKLDLLKPKLLMLELLKLHLLQLDLLKLKLLKPYLLKINLRKCNIVQHVEIKSQM